MNINDETPIRILHVIGIMNRGGAETMIMNLYRNIDRSKIQFDFVQNCEGPAAFDEEIIGLDGRIFHCPHYNGKNHFQYKKWWNDFFKVHKEEYVAVHGHLGSTAAIYLRIAKKYGLYTIAHSHNTVGSFVYSMYTYPTRFIADMFLACSQEAAISRYGHKVANNTSICRVLNNAIQVSNFQFDALVRAEIRSLYNLDDAFIIGHIGRFEEQKNHLFLIDIFEKVVQKRSNAMLVLVGDGFLRKTIEEKIDNLCLSDKVIFAGVRSDVNCLIQAMDVFVFPSLYEGLSLALVEAQISGLPCVVSDTIHDSGFLVKNNIQVVGLNDGAEKWTDAILSFENHERRDQSETIRNAGFDISETSKWLSDFYLDLV